MSDLSIVACEVFEEILRLSEPVGSLNRAYLFRELADSLLDAAKLLEEDLELLD